MSAVEKFAQQLPLNLEEIFIWYFEQKGVDNPERFLNIQEPQPENNQKLNALLPMLGILAEQQGKTKQEPDDMTKFLNNIEKLGNGEKGGNNEV